MNGVSGAHTNESAARRRNHARTDLFISRKKSSGSSDNEPEWPGTGSKGLNGSSMRLRKDSKQWDASSPKRGTSGAKRKAADKGCSTPECGNPPKLRRKTKHKTGLYCEKCAVEIDHLNYCQICLHLTAETAEQVQWVQCQDCEKWNHVKCEETQPDGISDLTFKLIEQGDKLIYRCSDCRGPSKPSPPDQAEMIAMMEIARPPRKQIKKATPCIVDNSYTYFYSENYQAIDKIISSAGKQLPLTTEEVNEDLSLIKLGTSQSTSA